MEILARMTSGTPKDTLQKHVCTQGWVVLVNSSNFEQCLAKQVHADSHAISLQIHAIVQLVLLLP